MSSIQAGICLHFVTMMLPSQQNVAFPCSRCKLHLWMGSGTQASPALTSAAARHDAQQAVFVPHACSSRATGLNAADSLPLAPVPAGALGLPVH